MSSNSLTHLFHATTDAAMDGIRLHGLDPEQRAEWAGRSRPVYLAGDADHAMAYVAHQDVESNGWLLRVAVADLDHDRLEADDVDLPDILSNDPEAAAIDSLDWMDSLHLCGQCAHCGAIGADKLWVVARVWANGTHQDIDEPVALSRWVSPDALAARVRRRPHMA